MAYLGHARRRGTQGLDDTRLNKALRLGWPRLERWVPAMVVVVALTGWEWQVRTGWLSALFFPSPSIIALTLARSLASGKLAVNMGATLSRVFSAFALGGVPGLILGLIMGTSLRLRILVDPFIAATHPIPKVALLPLVMILFGIGESSKVIVVAVAAFFPMLLNAMAGVQQISPIHFEVAANYGASPVKVFTRVVVPGSLPLVLMGGRLALNIALLITIAVEMVAAQEGLGAMIWLAWETLRTEELYAYLGVISVLGISFNLVLKRLTAWLVPWQVGQETW